MRDAANPDPGHSRIRVLERKVIIEMSGMSEDVEDHLDNKIHLQRAANKAWYSEI